MTNPEVVITTGTPEPETLEEQAQKVKVLVTQIFDNRHDFGEMSVFEGPIREQLEAMPREALVTAAWQGIGNYHRELTTWGDSPRLQRLELEKEYRKSLLRSGELEQAIDKANHWLHDNFGQ
jgi:hypothetical protein